MDNAQAHLETWRHIHTVQKLLANAQIELMRRQFTHDQSKLVDPEAEIFGEYTSRLKGLTYGSDEYKAGLKAMGPAISHHYEHNRHHPEHFKGESHWREEVAYLKGKMSELSGMVDATTPTQDNDVTIGATVDLLDRQKRELDSSINGMNLFDVLEMLIDWIAAVKRHDDGDISKSMEINRDRFNISPQLWQIMANTLTWLEEIEVPKTQRGLALCVRNQKQVNHPPLKAGVSQENKMNNGIGI